MTPLTRIAVQNEDFSLADEYERLQNQAECGAIVSFSGRVRDLATTPLLHMTLEHYPGMTEKALADIVQQARTRWPLGMITVIHRVGKLAVNEQIVLVLVSSAHRQAAFNACEFIMDFLKSRAPFWKKETTTEGTHWVEAKASDEAAVKRW
ncbi:molybdopterin synthase catalytic subunit MoaE [Thalassolituus marinus]|uniref:Molybdopterin synthase catalytic subunit n=1 Tax=Thalassolituus marinus TaxID=671053 RepID=A0ABS7ZPX1_9GAMM|nr:molybdopterin synthase catalytic subunit MoaE [Thalassolituus marinus]MCA6063748.1 molybdopterin synthase catalytic subunit MoaE [Thalassolituus marinus]